MRGLFVLGVAVTLLACGGSDGSSKQAGPGLGVGGASAREGGACTTGAEGCACYGNGTCDSGLVCASKLCVNLGGGGSTNGAGGSSELGGASEAGGSTGSGGFKGLGASIGAGGKTGIGASIGAGGKTGTGNATGAGGNTGTGNATGAGGVPGAGGSTGAGGSCTSTPGLFCTGDPTSCCVGLVCVADSLTPGESRCGSPCAIDSTCSSGCCAPLSPGSVSVCAPAVYCAPSCRSAGDSCTNDPTACCAGTTCVYDDASNTTASCLAECGSDIDCPSNCCTPLDSVTSVCEDPSYCGGSCLPVGTRPCGLGTDCCAGSYCTSDAINQICLPLCSTNADCSTGCCAIPNGNGIHVCTDPGYCGF